MKKFAFLLALTFFFTTNSQILITESQAAPRPCTGKEVAAELSYRAQIEVLNFYSPGSSTISTLRAQLQNVNLRGLRQVLQKLKLRFAQQLTLVS